jgi:spermidine/putrescine transport system ATP-binding protein
MRSELREIQRAVGITTIFVTHDQAEALGLSDRIAVMHAGRVEQLGSPREIYERPATRFVAEFIGASTVLRGHGAAADRVTLAGGETLRVLGLSGIRAGEAIELAIRPERIRLAGGPGENVMDGRVIGVVYQGVQTELTVEIGAGQGLLVFVAEPAPTVLAVGQALRLHLPADAFMRLGPAGAEAGR